MARKAYAAVGADGTRPVVWGLGSTPRVALNDARYELGCASRAAQGSEADLARDIAALIVVPISAELGYRARSGGVDASDLVEADERGGLRARR